MARYHDYADEFYFNVGLNTEMKLPSNRETVMGFFEQLQKHFPEMQNFYSRGSGEYVLEQKKVDGGYRWTTVEPKRVAFGQMNPEEFDQAVVKHRKIAELIPYFLSTSPLDCDSFNVTFGFDFAYTGNHNAIVAEALGWAPSLEKISEFPDAVPIDYEPSVQFALDDECKTQIRLSIDTKTGAHHVRTGEYGDENIGVFLTARHVGSLPAGESYAAAFDRILENCVTFADSYLIENVLIPLQQTIAIQ